ncbi:MATE family Na+-driven efflux transporter [Liberiplasma polymorphum]|uniref:MATE family Na+-driven efflux transporter n=1 Tax=Liberiplasma polymorphum TaxID=3374570 RepID=UPI0037741671
MNKVFNSIKLINFKLFWALMILAIMPTIYLTVRVNFLGDLPIDWGFNIASQLAWIHLLYEVIQEALLLPLFFILGLSLVNKKEFENKVRTGLLFTFIIYSVLALLVIVFARELTVFMQQQPSLIDATVSFIRLETLSSIFYTLFKFAMIVLISLNKDKYLYAILAVQMILTILLDTFLISQLSVSLNLGVNGIAVTNIIVNIVLLVITFVLLKRESIHIFSKNKLSFTWMKQWFKVGSYSGIESLVRNLAFSLMIIRLMNVVAEQGNFWVGNNFIWGWLLLPVLTFGDLVKKEIAENKNNIESNTIGYFAVTTIFVLIWLVTIPFWPWFLRVVMNVETYETVFYLVLIQLFFYITFAYNNIMDSTFYGLGKTHYMLYQSLIVNTLVYGTAFILYITGIFIPTLTSIAFLFGIGILFDMIPTVYLYVYLLRKEKLRII